MQLTLTPYLQPAVVAAPPVGWQRLGSDIGVQTYPGDIAQIRTAKGGWYYLSIVFGSGRVWNSSGYLPPNAAVTIRPDSPPPTLGHLRPRGDPSDFAGGGGSGIDACGMPGTVHDHDSTMHRHPVGFFDMVTGRLRDPKTIQLEGYYRITRSYPYNKVGKPPEYTVKYDAANPYDDRRLAADATAIPPGGETLRGQVLNFLAYDGQHLIRAYRFAILLQRDAVVRDDMRTMLRDVELAWPEDRAGSILSGPGGKGHSGVGREVAWCGYLAGMVEDQYPPAPALSRWARALDTVRGWVGLASTAPLPPYAVVPDRFRRILIHVQHTSTGYFQRFVEGMSGSPYPFGPKPNSGVPAGQGIALSQHLEACALVVCCKALKLPRLALKLCKSLYGQDQLKWINTDTGAREGGGWHESADDQAWGGAAIYVQLDRRAGLEACKRLKIPNDSVSEAERGPFQDLEKIEAAHEAWAARGKNAWILAELRK